MSAYDLDSAVQIQLLAEVFCNKQIPEDSSQSESSFGIRSFAMP